jgi:glucose/arabinose dehydrogenase
MKNRWILAILVLTYSLAGFANPGMIEKSSPASFFPVAQDSATVRAQRNFSNICASCHSEDMSWFTTREWKYGKTKNDIYTSAKTGYPEFGMPSFKKALTDQELKDIAKLIYNKLEFNIGENGIKDLDTKRIPTEKLNIRLDTIFTGLNSPWGMVFLPNGDMLVNDREGKMIRIKDGKKIAEIQGVPEVQAVGQGGLLDLRLHPDYSKNGWIYFAYSSCSVNEEAGWNTTLMRARIKDNNLIDKQLLFKAMPDTKAGQHLGGRITFDGKGHLFLSCGERGKGENAQDLSNDCGKIHRLNDDGTIPADNPFVNQAGAKQSIWSYGHRNAQGLIYNTETGILWETEHGPKGGDELNIIQRGKNYGWPVISFGINYDGTILTKDTAKIGMEQPISYWVPSIAPSGMAFVKGNRYKGWEGNILVGSLRFMYLVRCEMKGNTVTHKEILFPNIGRLRDVEMSPDGFIYISVESPGIIFRLVPVE